MARSTIWRNVDFWPWRSTPATTASEYLEFAEPTLTTRPSFAPGALRPISHKSTPSISILAGICGATVDYLVSRDDIDAKRLGMIGFSMGGIETWLAASVDTRIRVAVPAIGVQSLRWSLEHEQWQGRANTIRAAHEAAARDLGEREVNSRVCKALWTKICPGILDQFDCPEHVASVCRSARC